MLEEMAQKALKAVGLAYKKSLTKKEMATVEDYVRRDMSMCQYAHAVIGRLRHLAA